MFYLVHLLYSERFLDLEEHISFNFGYGVTYESKNEFITLRNWYGWRTIGSVSGHVGGTHKKIMIEYQEVE